MPHKEYKAKEYKAKVYQLLDVHGVPKEAVDAMPPAPDQDEYGPVYNEADLEMMGGDQQNEAQPPLMAGVPAPMANVMANPPYLYQDGADMPKAKYSNKFADVSAFSKSKIRGLFAFHVQSGNMKPEEAMELIGLMREQYGKIEKKLRDNSYEVMWLPSSNGTRIDFFPLH